MDKKLFLAAMRKKIYGEEFFSPSQKEMFPELRRELNLEIEDIAKSDDPVEACMERQGYTPAKIREFQRAISEKLTPDMFGKTEKITGAEAMYQEKIEECLEKAKPKRKQEKESSLFGVEDVIPYFYDDTNEAYMIDPTIEYDPKHKRYFHTVYTRSKSGKLIKSNTRIPDDKFKDKFLPGIKRESRKQPGEQLRLFGSLAAVDIMTGPWMEDRPFTKEQVNSYNRYRMSEYDINKWFYDEIVPMENSLKDQYANFDMDIPENVKIALAWLRRRTYDQYMTDARANNYAPSPFVVGPAKYHNFEKKRDRSNKWEAEAQSAKEESRKRLEKEIKATMPKTIFQQYQISEAMYNKFFPMATTMKKRQFGKYFFDYVYENFPERRKDLDLKWFADVERKEGYALQKKILMIARDKNLEIPAEIVKENQDIFAKAEYEAEKAEKLKARREKDEQTRKIIEKAMHNIYERRAEAEKEQEQLDFLKQHSPTQLVIPGTKTPEQLRLFGRIRRSLRYA